MKINKVYEGDCRQVLKNFPDDFVDLIIADPPFGIKFQKQMSIYNRKAENVIDGYQEVNVNYYDFMREWLNEAYRILSTTGSIFVVSGWTHLKEVLEAIDDVGFHVINHIIWKYQFGVFTKRKFVTSHYHIIFAVKHPKKYKFFKQEHYPEDVWNIKREYWRGKQKTPTRLPEKLVEKMILYTTQENDLVLDPFMGSGTTAVVATKLKRKWIGVEIVPEYIEFTYKRLSNM